MAWLTGRSGTNDRYWRWDAVMNIITTCTVSTVWEYLGRAIPQGVLGEYTFIRLAKQQVINLSNQDALTKVRRNPPLRSRFSGYNPGWASSCLSLVQKEWKNDGYSKNSHILMGNRRTRPSHEYLGRNWIVINRAIDTALLTSRHFSASCLATTHKHSRNIAIKIPSRSAIFLKCREVLSEVSQCKW